MVQGSLCSEEPGVNSQWGDCCHFSASHSRLPLPKAFAPWPQSRGCRRCVVGACCEPVRGFELLPQGLFLKILSLRALGLSGTGEEKNRTQTGGQGTMAEQGVSNTLLFVSRGLPSWELRLWFGPCDKSMCTEDQLGGWDHQRKLITRDEAPSVTSLCHFCLWGSWASVSS